MRKSLVLLLLIAVVFTLVGCGNREAEMMDVTIAEETMGFRDIEVHAIIELELDSNEQLLEIANSIASQSYEQYFNDIGYDTYVLVIYLYASQTQYDSDNTDYGSISFMINDSLETPGLSLLSNDLVLE